MTPLSVATFAFTATADIHANTNLLAAGLRAAAAAKAQVFVAPECALVGYPGAARTDFSGLSWCQVGEAEEHLEHLARQLGLIAMIGTVSPNADTTQRYNSAVILNASATPQRYHKRRLTPLDQQHFIPGAATQTGVYDLAGWRVGISICYEVRFGASWATQAATPVDLFIALAHMAGPDVDPGTKAAVIPALYSARACEWVTPLVLANTAADDRWLDSGAWDARGVQITNHTDGLAVTTITPRDTLAPWYQTVRHDALRG